MAITTSSTPSFSIEPECFASEKQQVVRWKDMYWFPCRYTWNSICIWPIRRKHITYKVTVSEGIPVHDENGNVIPMADGKRRDWTVYDSTQWNAIGDNPVQRERFPDFEPIADNEYVVLVETRYRLFNDVESTIRICTQKP